MKTLKALVTGTANTQQAVEAFIYLFIPVMVLVTVFAQYI